MSTLYSPSAQRFGRVWRVGLLWAMLALWPLLAPNDYLLSLGVIFFVNLLLISGLNLVMGFAGQISLCHGGLYGLGAYLSGVLAIRYHVTPLLGIGLSMLITAAAAGLIGLPALRLRGNYLAMATLGFNAILTVLFVELVGLTGGPNGLNGIPPIVIGSFAFDTTARFFWLAWLAGALVTVLIALLLSSRAGRALRAVSGSEVAAASLGIDPFRVKLAAFMLAAASAALAGALYGHFNQFVSPEMFSFSTSVLLVVMVALGGWANFWGPLFGALLYTAVPELLRDLHDAELLVFGACMIAVLLFWPRGLAGALDRLGRGDRQSSGQSRPQGQGQSQGQSADPSQGRPKAADGH